MSLIDLTGQSPPARCGAGSGVRLLEGGMDSAIRFRKALISALAARSSLRGCVKVHEADDYARRNLFMDDEGLCGFALKEGEIASVFRHPALAGGPVLQSLMTLAVRHGGSHLDAFDTRLPELYALCGFNAVARLSWNDALAPDEWDYAAFRDFNGGRPDVVFMAHGVPAVPPLVVGTYEEGLICQKMAVLMAREARS